MKIAAIEPLDKRRSKVLFDEGFALVLYGRELRCYHIRLGEELTPESYEEIIRKVLMPRARERMLYLLKASDKTEAEVRRKLRDGFYPEEVIDAAVSFARQHHYIDDRSYVERYIRYQGKRKSQKQICFELQRKGIDRDLINDCVEETPIDESQLVHAYLRKKGLGGRSLTPEERQKVSVALARKGISWDIIRSALREDSDGGS